MGLHSSPTGELIFEDCRVPAANRLGQEGEGFKIALSSLDGGRINIGAMATGVPRPRWRSPRAMPRSASVWPADWRVRGDSVPAGRYGDEDRGSAADGLSGGV